MYLELSRFDQFIEYLERGTMHSSLPRPTIGLDTLDCMTWLPNQTAQELEGFFPDLAGKVESGDVFPIVKVTLRAALSLPLTRFDDAGRIQNDVDEARYETWVSANSNFPIGRTDEFSLVSEFREKLEEAQRNGFQVSFDSERPRMWFREKLEEE